MRCVRFASYCGQMYRRHLFSYGGLAGASCTRDMVKIHIIDRFGQYELYAFWSVKRLPDLPAMD